MPTGFQEDPLPDLLNQAELLECADEMIRSEQTARRTGPAKQGLDAEFAVEIDPRKSDAVPSTKGSL